MKLNGFLFSVTFEDQRNNSLISTIGQMLMFAQWNPQVELSGRGTCYNGNDSRLAEKIEKEFCLVDSGT